MISHMPKLIKLYPLKMYSLLYINYFIKAVKNTRSQIINHFNPTI